MIRKALLPLAALIALAACRQEDMYTQERAVPWSTFSLFRNDRTMQSPVPGSVARDAPNGPVPQPQTITAALLARGQQKFNVDCMPCHGQSGNGEGIVVQRGFPKPPDFTSNDLLHAKAQFFYNVITHGHGVMYSYADRVAPLDRWAIIAYIRALQLSRHAQVASLSATDKAALQGALAMKRLSIILAAAGAVLLLLGLLLSLLAGAATMPSYLATWLFWSSLPLGALPVVMLLDLAGPGAGFGLEPILRRMLVLTPLAAVLMVPILVRPEALFGWAMGHGFSAPFGKVWMQHGWFIVRSIVYFGTLDRAGGDVHPPASARSHLSPPGFRRDRLVPLRAQCFGRIGRLGRRRRTSVDLRRIPDAADRLASHDRH